MSGKELQWEQSRLDFMLATRSHQFHTPSHPLALFSSFLSFPLIKRFSLQGTKDEAEKYENEETCN